MDFPALLAVPTTLEQVDGSLVVYESPIPLLCADRTHCIEKGRSFFYWSMTSKFMTLGRHFYKRESAAEGSFMQPNDEMFGIL